jgi:hypothetical protein
MVFCTAYQAADGQDVRNWMSANANLHSFSRTCSQKNSSARLSLSSAETPAQVAHWLSSAATGKQEAENEPFLPILRLQSMLGVNDSMTNCDAYDQAQKVVESDGNDVFPVTIGFCHRFSPLQSFLRHHSG